MSDGDLGAVDCVDLDTGRVFQVGSAAGTPLWIKSDTVKYWPPIHNEAHPFTMRQEDIRGQVSLLIGIFHESRTVQQPNNALHLTPSPASTCSGSVGLLGLGAGERGR